MTAHFAVPLFRFVRPLGFEPRTCGLRVRCSAVELEAHTGPAPKGRFVPFMPLRPWNLYG